MKKEVYEEALRLIDSRISYLLREIQIATSKPIVIRAPLSPPLILDSAALIRNLNAERLGGLTIDQVLAKISTAAGVSSLGKYGEAETLTGDVKLKEGANVQISRDDANNALIVGAQGASGAPSDLTYVTKLDETPQLPNSIRHQDIPEAYRHPPKTHTHTESDITDLNHDAQKIRGKIVDDAAIGNGKVLVYRTSGDKLQYENQAGGGLHGNEMHDPDFLAEDGSVALAGNLDFAQHQALKFVFERLASAPASPVEAQCYYNTTQKKAYYYDGAQWKEFCPTKPVEEVSIVSPAQMQPSESMSESVQVTETST